MNIKGLIKKIYYSFIHDTIRLYKVLPKKFKKSFFSIFLLQFLLALIEMATIIILTFFSLSLAIPEESKNNIVVRYIFNYFPKLAALCENHGTYVLVTCLVMLFFIGFKNIFSAFTVYKTNNFAENISIYIAENTIERYLYKDYFWHISPKSQDIIQRLNHRVNLTALISTLLQLYSNVISSIMLFFSLFLAEPKLTLVVIIVFSSVSILTYIKLKKKLDIAGKISADASVKENINMMAAVTGVREIILYQRQKQVLNGLTDAMTEGKASRIFLGMSAGFPSWILETAGFSTILMVLLYLIYKKVPMPDIIQAMSMLMLTAWRVLPFVVRVLGATVVMRGIRPMALMCLELLERLIIDNKEKERLEINTKPIIFNKSLTIKNVSFCYPTATKSSLDNVSFTINKGEHVGLVGLSGAGKSTIALILSGLILPTSGNFFIDDIEINDQNRNSYIKNIGFVPQNPFLLPGSVADNVAFSKWGEEYSKKEVEYVCHKAAMDYLFTSPKGVDLKIGNNSSGLSGGELQRLSIARALFTNPSIIIFDEATSALDQANENIILDTINNLDKNITVITIAHRLATVEKCNKIIWFEKGKIKSIGSPKEILLEYNNFLLRDNKNKDDM